MVQTKHIGCYGFLIKDEKIVLIKKARGAFTGLLDLPGGGMEHGENPKETVKREIKEEAGVDIIDAKLIDVFSNRVSWLDGDEIEDLHHIGILYEIIYDEQNIKTDPDGIDSLGASYYEISKLKKENLSPFTIMGLEKLGYKINN